ncbi:MAG: flavin reductase [Anaerolineae bacterium]|nr:MAG: flavin reductase [Anaerolineae bacterium]
MDAQTRKTALRMIPYGLYVLTAATDGEIAAGAVNWVTQASFEPPLVVVAVRADSHLHGVIRQAQSFALNVLRKDQGNLAFTFFKPVKREGQTLGGEPFHPGVTGAPILESTPAFIECRVVEAVSKGDHTVFVGEVVDVGLNEEIEGRPDEVTLWLRDLGENIFYGG